MKKLLKGTSLLLMLTLVLTTIFPIGTFAKETNTANNSGTSNVMTFDNLAEDQTLANYLHSNSVNFLNENNMLENIDTTTENKRAMIAAESENNGFGNSLYIETSNYYQSSVFIYRMNNSSSVSHNFHTEFSFKNTNAANFCLSIGGNHLLIFTKEGYVYAFGEQLDTCTHNVWHDVKFTYCPTISTARIEIKDSTSSAWKKYDLLLTNNTIANNTKTYHQVAFSNQRNTTNLVKAYVDNVYFTNIDVADVAPVFYESDFEEDGDFEYYSGLGGSWTKTKWQFENYWTTTDGTTTQNVTAELAQLAGYDGKVLEIENVSGVHKNAQLNLRPFGTGTVTDNGAIHSINFKLGYDGMKDYAMIKLGLDSVVTDSGADGVTAVKLKDGKLYLNGEAEANVVSGVNILPDKMYDFSVLYKGDGTYKSIIFTDLDGTQYKQELSLGNGAIKNLTIYFPTGNLAKIYFDDLTWSAFNAASFDTTGNALISGYETTGAALDDGAEIKLNQTPDLSNAVTVTVTKDGVAATPEYKLIDTADGMAVKFTKLDKNAEYEVTVSGIKNMAGTALADQTVSFKTLNYDYEVSKPEISASNVVTVNAKSAYLDFGAYIIVAKYNGGVLEDIDQKVININSNETQTFEFDPGFTDATEVKAFVWSDYQTLIPLSESNAK